MKKTLLIAFGVLSLFVAADEKIFSDNFKRASWRIANTANYAEVAENTLKLTENKTYIHIVRGEFPWSAKYSFSVKARGNGNFKLGAWVRGQEIVKLWKLWSDEFFLNNEFKTYEFTFVIPERSPSLTLCIQGLAEVKEAVLIRKINPDYRLTASPPYQMYSDQPEPVSFTLYHAGKAIANAEIKEKGVDAVHLESGQTAHAYLVKADTTRFEAAARNIKLEKPVSILYLGDSLTHYDLGFNHVDKVGYFLNKYNPGKAEVWNYACGGDDIQRVILRLDGKAPGRHRNRYHDLWSRKYDWVFIFLGHNDTKASSANGYKEPVIPVAKQKELFEILIARLKNHGIKRIILISPTSSNFELCRERAEKIQRVHNLFGIPEHMEAYAKALIELAEKHQLEYLDVYTPMKSHPDKASLLFPNDGVHLSAAGHDFIALETLKYLNKKEK